MDAHTQLVARFFKREAAVPHDVRRGGLHARLVEAAADDLGALPLTGEGVDAHRGHDLFHLAPRRHLFLHAGTEPAEDASRGQAHHQEAVVALEHEVLADRELPTGVVHRCDGGVAAGVPHADDRLVLRTEQVDRALRFLLRQYHAVLLGVVDHAFPTLTEDAAEDDRLCELPLILRDLVVGHAELR